MTRVRSTVSLSFFCLLTFATSAAAECAWVLWESTGISDTSKVSTQPVAAQATRQADERVLGVALAKFKNNTGMFVKVDEEIHEAFLTMKKTDSSMTTTFFHYVCLPDTGDPRGPKGGGR